MKDMTRCVAQRTRIERRLNTAAMSYQTENPRFIKAFVQAGVLAQGLLQCLAVVAPQPRLGFVRVLAANHSSRHPALRIRRGKRATPGTSRISHGYRKKRSSHQIPRSSGDGFP